MSCGALPLVEAAPQHRPVMVEQVMSVLRPARGRLLVDGTLGPGGHARAWLEQSAPDGRVIGLDRDASALERAAETLAPYGARAIVRHEDYRSAARVMDELGITSADAVLLDLGLGSHQLDDPARGFSFRLDGPLDMRFDRDGAGPTAAEILAHSPEPELARIFIEWGEIRLGRKLARAIAERRRRAPITTSAELAELSRSVLPPGRRQRRIDPSTLVFQALRIAVNEELSGLDAAIESLALRLRPGGRIAVLAFHSLEDRIAKRTLRRLAEPCRCRRGDPCGCGAVEMIDLEQRRAERPRESEIAANPRARSARLRWGVRR